MVTGRRGRRESKRDNKLLSEFRANGCRRLWLGYGCCSVSLPYKLHTWDGRIVHTKKHFLLPPSFACFLLQTTLSLLHPSKEHPFPSSHDLALSSDNWVAAVLWETPCSENFIPLNSSPLRYRSRALRTVTSNDGIDSKFKSRFCWANHFSFATWKQNVLKAKSFPLIICFH